MKSGLRYCILAFATGACVACAELFATAIQSDSSGLIEIKSDSTGAFRHLIDQSHNVIVDRGNNMQNIIKRLDDSRHDSTIVVPILHIGDSHIQAGFISGEVAQQFRNNFGDAGRGVIVPLKIAGTNEPSDYRIVSPNSWSASKCVERGLTQKIGLTGVEISTTQSNIEFTITSPTDFSVVRVFHHERAPLLAAPEELQIGSFCDQNDTQNSTTIVLNNNVKSVTLTAHSQGQYNAGCFYGFSLENDRAGVIYHSIGLNGATYDHYNTNSEIATQSALLSPDLIIVSLGTNDAYATKFDSTATYNHVENMVKGLRQANPTASILLTTPMDCARRTYSRGRPKYTYNTNMEQMSKVIIRAAQNNNVAFWDAFAACGGNTACKKWDANGLFQKDMVHLTKEGSQLKASAFFEAFAKYYNSNI